MRKYGVYVKLNSAEEMHRLALDDEENVLARTPAKNVLNLEHLRAGIMEPVHACSSCRETISFLLTHLLFLRGRSVPRRYHRALFGEKAIFLRDIENKTNCKVTFPR